MPHAGMGAMLIGGSSAHSQSCVHCCPGLQTYVGGMWHGRYVAWVVRGVGGLYVAWAVHGMGLLLVRYPVCTVVLGCKQG